MTSTLTAPQASAGTSSRAADPAAGMPVAAIRLNAERGACLDHRRLERLDQRPHEQPALTELQDRVRHELAGPVVGHLTTALHADDLDAAPTQLRRPRQDVRLVGLATERQDRVVLEEQQLVGGLPGDAALEQLLLAGPGLPVADPAEPCRLDRRVHRARLLEALGSPRIRA